MNPSHKDPVEKSPSRSLLEERLGHHFSNTSLLDTALRHSSYANEHPGLESNERLEFLGDAVIGLVVGELLYSNQPHWQEGELTRGLHRLVDKPACASLARKLHIGPYLELGRTERQSNGADKDSILADALEAILGAVFLDGGLAAVRNFIERAYVKEISEDARPVERDIKTRLQEHAMATFGEFPKYELQSDSQIEGADERFTVCVFVDQKVYGTGVGRTKRAAEFEAAQIAWQALQAKAPHDE